MLGPLHWSFEELPNLPFDHMTKEKWKWGEKKKSNFIENIILILKYKKQSFATRKIMDFHGFFDPDFGKNFLKTADLYTFRLWRHFPQIQMSPTIEFFRLNRINRCSRHCRLTLHGIILPGWQWNHPRRPKIVLFSVKLDPHGRTDLLV